MSDTVYLTTEQVVNIARDRWAASVRDLAVVDAAVMACRASFDGHEPYPTVLDKAACLMAGLASTQGFVDGNKRTAWTATETFLAVNGVYLEPPEECATVFGYAMSQRDLLDHEDSVNWLLAHRVNR